jgi:hypothetical protein
MKTVTIGNPIDLSRDGVQFNLLHVRDHRVPFVMASIAAGASQGRAVT